MTSSQRPYAFIVFSHSSYADVWPVLFESYARFFDSDLFDFYITSDQCVENALVEKSGFKFLIYPENLSWSDAFFECVRGLRYSRYVFSFDDLVLVEKVKSAEISKSMRQQEFDYLKVICSHVRFYNRFLQRGDYFDVPSYDSYRGSVVFTMLTRELLEKIIAMPELSHCSAWEFERKVNKSLPAEFRYGAVRRNVFKFKNLVIKGAVNPISRWWLGLRFGLDYSGGRPSMTMRQLLHYYAKLGVFTAVKYFAPPGWFAALRRVKHHASVSNEAN